MAGTFDVTDMVNEAMEYGVDLRERKDIDIVLDGGRLFVFHISALKAVKKALEELRAQNS